MYKSFILEGMNIIPEILTSGSPQVGPIGLDQTVLRQQITRLFLHMSVLKELKP
jgi:hypothetical protein